MDAFDAVVVGFGKGGKTLAAALANRGWSVAMVERSPKMYGGTCINIACIPTKTLVHDAALGIDYAQAIDRKDDVTSTLRKINHDALAGNAHVAIFTAEASFADAHHLRLRSADDERTIRGERIVINTGSAPVLPDIPGLAEGPRVFTSTSLMEERTLPSRLAIIGAGYVGLEFASLYARFGAQVTVLDPSPTLLGREDADIAAEARLVLEAQGVAFHLDSRVRAVDPRADHATLECEEKGASRTHEADAVLVATGRAPYTKGLDLDKAGVELTTHGAIKVDDRLRTSVPHIWAVGDVNGGPQHTYISLDDSRIVRDQFLGEGKRSTRDRGHVPYCLFTDVPLARVGMTEQDARARSVEYRVARLPVAAIPRSRVDGDTRGVLKALVAKDSDELLGVALFCRQAPEMINVAKTVMDAKLPYTVLRDQIFTHPTMSEAYNDLFARI